MYKPSAAAQVLDCGLALRQAVGFHVEQAHRKATSIEMRHAGYLKGQGCRDVSPSIKRIKPCVVALQPLHSGMSSFQSATRLPRIADLLPATGGCWGPTGCFQSACGRADNVTGILSPACTPSPGRGRWQHHHENVCCVPCPRAAKNDTEVATAPKTPPCASRHLNALTDYSRAAGLGVTHQASRGA